MKINGQTIEAQEFGWDECHKIYLVETPKDKQELTELEYKLFPIKELPQAWADSCSLKFISHGNLDLPNVVNQFEEAIFEGLV